MKGTALAALALALVFPGAQAAGTGDDLLDRELAALAPQRPGHPDLYVLAVAGDGTEQVFRNEALHLQQLAQRRLDAVGRSLVLANHAPEPPLLKPLPEATPATLAAALAGLGRRMDPAEDLLLLYFTTHGTEDHQLLLRRPDKADDLLSPAQLRQALDASGIRHRVLVLSACFSGGFIKALRGPDTMVLTAARHDRASFGCGNDSVATFFGRAWLVDGLNASVDFEQAFTGALDAIERREMAEGLEPSLPQRSWGEGIAATLAAWRGSFVPGPPLPYPHVAVEAEPEAAAEIIPPLKPTGSPRSP